MNWLREAVLRYHLLRVLRQVPDRRRVNAYPIGYLQAAIMLAVCFAPCSKVLSGAVHGSSSAFAATQEWLSSARVCSLPLPTLRPHGFLGAIGGALELTTRPRNDLVSFDYFSVSGATLRLRCHRVAS